MLIETAIVGILTVPLMIVSKIVATKLGQTGWRIVPFQMKAVGGLAGAFAFVGSLPLYIVIVATLTPLLINIFGLVYRKWQKRRALNGLYGEETQWAAEIVNGGDIEFAYAIKQLPERELAEIGIIAESKDELRQLTVERLNELSSDEIPEDFAQ